MNAFASASLLGCRDCHVLHRVLSDLPPAWDEAAEESVDAQTHFLALHAAHRLAQFRPCGSESQSDRPLWDPMATICFEITDGERTYVATASRRSIDDPREYRFFPGALEACNAEVTVDDTDLRRGLDTQFHPHALRGSKIDRFVAIVHEVVSRIDPEEVEIAFADADDPAVTIARMPDVAYEELRARCSEVFAGWEWSMVSAFLRDNRDADGLLTLRLRRTLRTVAA